MKKIVFLSIFVLIVVAVVGGFWYVKSQEAAIIEKSLTTKEENKQEIIPVSTEEIDRSNWQTYRNEEYDFEFKYPQEWIIEESTNETMAVFDKLLVKIRPIETNDENKNLVFYVNVFNSDSSPKEWYQTEVEATDKNKKFEGHSRELEMNDLDAYYLFKKGDSYQDMNYVISKDGLILLITFRVARDYVGLSYEKYIPYFESLVKSVK